MRRDIRDSIRFKILYPLLGIVVMPIVAVLVIRATVAIRIHLLDFKEHGVREIIRAHPRHPRGLILAILKNLAEENRLIERGFGAGRRYRININRRRRKPTKEAKRLWGDDMIGGTAWAR